MDGGAEDSDGSIGAHDGVSSVVRPDVCGRWCCRKGDAGCVKSELGGESRVSDRV